MYGDELECDAPMPTPTPYGNRLTWKMPGQSNLIVHLKDKTKIRHKKRWSQVWQHMQLVDKYVVIVSLQCSKQVYISMTRSYDTGTHFYNTIISLNNLNVQDFTSPLTKIIDLSDIFINEHTHCSVFLSGFVFGWFKVERVIYVSPVGQQISDKQGYAFLFHEV